MKVFFDVSASRIAKLNGEALIAAEDWSAGENITLRNMRALLSGLMNDEQGQPIPPKIAQRMFNEWDSDQITEAFQSLAQAVKDNAVPPPTGSNSTPLSIRAEALPDGSQNSNLQPSGDALRGPSEAASPSQTGSAVSGTSAG